MPTKLLLGALALELLSEMFFSFAAIFAPAWTLRLFQVEASPVALQLTFILGLFLGFISVMIALAMHGIAIGARHGWWLARALGLFWIVYGGALFLRYGRTESIYMDLFPGLIIAAAASASKIKS